MGDAKNISKNTQQQVEMAHKTAKIVHKNVLICWGGIIIILKYWAENWSLKPKLDRKWA